jgi:hypothetical protein
MTLVHTLGDPPRLCWACVDDMVNAPDEPMGDHEPEVAGADDDGEFCVCGHHVERVASSGFFTPEVTR